VEQRRHLRARLEVALGVLEQRPSGSIERGLVADTGQHVEQPPAGRRGMPYVVGRDQRDLIAPGNGNERAVESFLVGIKVTLHVDVKPAGEKIPQAGEGKFEIRNSKFEIVSPGETDEAVGVSVEVFPRRHRFTLGRAQLGLGDEPAEILIADAGGSEEIERGRRVRRTGQRQFRADDGPQTGARRRLMKARCAVHAVTIAESQRRIAERRGARDEIFRQRSPGEEAEGAAGAQFDVLGEDQSYTPSTNQLCVVTSQNNR
jgi:hypothetical protein